MSWKISPYCCAERRGAMPTSETKSSSFSLRTENPQSSGQRAKSDSTWCSSCDWIFMGLPYSRHIAKGRTHRGPAGLIRLLTTMSCACDMGSSYAPRTYESLTDCLLLAYLYDLLQRSARWARF